MHRSFRKKFILSAAVMIALAYLVAAGVLFLLYNIEFRFIDTSGFHGIGIFRMLLFFYLMSLLIEGMVFYRLNRVFLNPINQLSAGISEMAKGNYDVRVDTNVKTEELQALMVGFNQMAREISSVEMFKKDFISYFSHEFKTPIASIQGFARQIKDQPLSEAELKEYAGIIHAEAERLSKLSGNVLMLTKLEHEMDLPMEDEFDVDEQLRQVVLLLVDQWQGKNLELDLDLDPVRIKSSEEWTKQIWINLIHNAIRYSEVGAKLLIEASIDGEFVKVKVQDFGVGMDDETRLRIFDKFYQGDDSGKPTGNGLGLPIVKRIVELVGGRIAVKSQLGKGTTMLVYLPLKV